MYGPVPPKEDAMNTHDKLRRADCNDEEAEAIAQAIKEVEPELRRCSGDCSDCHKINTCMN